MKTLAAALLTLAALALLAPAAHAQAPSLTGPWLVTADFYGTPRLYNLQLIQQADKLTGDFSGDKLEGTVSPAGNGKDATVKFFGKDNEGGTEDVKATFANNILTGSVHETHPGEENHPLDYTFTATLIPARPTAAPQRHEFVPTVYYRSFSPFNKPVLTVNPGDTIHTTTVDAGGNDFNDIKRVAGGNPQTGPFYIQSAAPGDTLVVHINRLRLNRATAESDDGMVQSSLNSDLAVKMKDVGRSITWNLDRANGTATPEQPKPKAGETATNHLANYKIPLRPMLGCIATATGPSGSPPPTGDSGNWGGNMDFNEIVEGATIYLPIQNPGALLYLGDAHAAQGDGELNGNALETSMDIEFTVDVIPAKRIRAVRVESPTHIMATAYAGSLDDAFKDATANMAQWLEQDYKLTPSEIAQVLGASAEYRVSEVADRNSGIVLKLNKDRLATFTKTP